MSEDITAFTRISNKHKVLTKEQERELLVRALGEPRDLAAWDLLVKHNVALVINMAKKYLNQGLSFEDLIMEGICGLHTAIGKFDLKRGGKLSTYATWWIRQAITRAIDNHSRAIRIPIHKLNEYRVVRRTYREFIEHWEGELVPTPEILSALITEASLKDPNKRIKAMTKEEVEFLWRMLQRPKSLNEAQTEDENLTVLDFLASSPEDQPEERVELTQNKTRLMYYIAQLEPEEQIFVMLKFGLMDGKERDKREMAAFKRMSDTEAQKKLDSILAKLRKIMPAGEFCLD